MRQTQEIQKSVTAEAILKLVSIAIEVMKDDPIVLNIDPKVTVVGDIHGNIDDLIRIFEKSGYPPETKYLFLGDYIDRGDYGIEVLTMLLALKVKFPDKIWLLRGNHETLHISRNYGFMKECTWKYSPVFFFKIMRIFQCLPLAAIIGNSIFCVHGGISQHLKKIEDLQNLAKPDEEMDNEIFTDIVWSDPSNLVTCFFPSKRGAGQLFGLKALENFLNLNNLKMLIRSHEFCQNGFDFPFGECKKCCTVFSNSDYCGLKNHAATVSITEDYKLQFNEIPLLSEMEIQKRRVIIPKWLIDSQNMMVELISPLTDDIFEISSGFENLVDTTCC
ncbi:Ser/Thr protein phosphatase [Histomonas meleagridis]|uniref:Ser/Thr protein phosphatase n=1 Tax=Histomonas meleagridis TaxID=135588 RepID=UPI00355944E5|nr:Ser/Thr protein phosphatase [Histomonas meleagridis]KAH0799641.1 Ser/Thr protein phosphatase [Histomonas meleagridis]